MAFSPVVLNTGNRFEFDSPHVLSTMVASVTPALTTDKPDKKKVWSSIYLWYIISDGFNSFGEEGMQTGIHGSGDIVTFWYARKWSLAETGWELQQLPQVTCSPQLGKQSLLRVHDLKT